MRLGGEATTGSSAEIAFHVAGQAVGRLVAPRAVLLEALHHDPVQLALEALDELGAAQPPMLGRLVQLLAQAAGPGAGPGRVLLADDALDLAEAGAAQLLRCRRACTPASIS